MPHVSGPGRSGFQALILCGPGVSLNTFTSNPEEFPKALVPIANRPMVWYPLDWCYRMGVTNITLITPPASQGPLEAALSQNPHLTSLPSPSPSLVAPTDLTLTTGTAELLRLPEVQACIKTDFLLLPCDLICELSGESILEAWMYSQGSLDGLSVPEPFSYRPSSTVGRNGEKAGRRGGIGVWYPMATKQEGVKGEVADFVATAPLDGNDAPVINSARDGSASVRSALSKLVYAMPMDTLKDIMEEKKAFLVRHSLMKKHARVKLLTTYRDAHIYIFPYWVKEMAKRNEKFQSVSEDLVGWWAKAEWQDGLAEKLGLREVFEHKENYGLQSINQDEDLIEREIDLLTMSTTKFGASNNSDLQDASFHESSERPSLLSRTTTMLTVHDSIESSNEPLTVPSIFAYLHPSLPTAPLIRRVDNASLLLNTSLQLAKLESRDTIDPADASPLSHAHKIAYPAGVAPRSSITRADCLIAENVTVEEKCVIKESVIGANCHIASGARLTKCLLMDGAVVGERCQLTGCVVGRRSKIGRESVLKDCEVQDGNVVPDETDAKNEKFMVFEGLDHDEDGDMGEGGFSDGDDREGF
ncbi:hypothetical protein AJ80_03266 [Polytolypa hystricis UAMH7299]|uniref:Translation initiation factor eIF2B subunit gamma n=1 Tax=Polytolypa hystricis (strain UAMH7299) TaxID=1447883 RepID=A0A2B7YJJ3_POLH7|nr:hypothetical protein AJ80_03266 [Polytolypa hystricis UAMH7299]